VAAAPCADPAALTNSTPRSTPSRRTWCGSAPTWTSGACPQAQEQASGCLRYLFKDLTKSVAECFDPETDTAAAHLERLTDALRCDPTSDVRQLTALRRPTRGAKSGQVPGYCRSKAHKPENLRLRRPP